jgi:hypothetical protein
MKLTSPNCTNICDSEDIDMTLECDITESQRTFECEELEKNEAGNSRVNARWVCP